MYPRTCTPARATVRADLLEDLDARARDEVRDGHDRRKPDQRERGVTPDPEPELPAVRVQHRVRAVGPVLHQVGAVTPRATRPRLTHFRLHERLELRER